MKRMFVVLLVAALFTAWTSSAMAVGRKSGKTGHSAACGPVKAVVDAPKPAPEQPKPVIKPAQEAPPAKPAAKPAEEKPVIKPEPKPVEKPSEKPSEKAAALSGLRLWTDNTGKYAVQAVFLAADAQGVTLERFDGYRVHVKWERLSTIDRWTALEMSSMVAVAQ